MKWWWQRRAERQRSDQAIAAMAARDIAEAEQRHAQQRAWIAALPLDLQADVASVPPSELTFLMETAALTPASDCANAIRRWRTMPDDPPRREAGMPLATFVDSLFATQLRPDGTRYTEDDIASAFDGQVDPQAVQRLRTAIPADLDLDLIFKVGRFFHVPPEYFFPGVHLRRFGSPLGPGNRRAAEEVLQMVFSGEFAQQVRDTEQVNWKT